MRYTFLTYSPSSAPDDEPREATPEQLAVFGAYIGALKQAGVFVDTDWLQPSTTATAVSMADGELRIQDGPFADTRDQLGGYFVVDVPDLDAALEWAKKCPIVHFGTVEVRPSAMPPGQMDNHN